ncbi:MAG: hypothetical protein PVH22_09515 [Desulfobacteraceae bacterium]|jgi:ribosomal protein L37E
MENDRYNVILAYDPGNSDIHRKVIARLFDLKPEAAKQFQIAEFTGQMIVKRGADLTTAKRLGHLFRGTGATISFQKTVSQPASLDGNPEASGRAADTTATCPKCGHQQSREKEECSACGIIFARIKTRPAPVQTQAPVAHKQPPKPPVWRRMLKETEKISPLLVALKRKIQPPASVEKISGWGQGVADRLIRCGLRFIIALIIEAGSLLLIRMSWFLYIATTTGQYYMKRFPEKAEVYNRIVQTDPLSLGLDTTLTVLWVGLLVGVAARLLNLIHHLYESQGFIGKLVIWFAPFIGATAWIMTLKEPFPEIPEAVMLVALPALCMLSSCLYLAQAILPRVGTRKKDSNTIQE